jgi:glycosyltransferase involved in cell wall biosynthesis
MPKTSIIISFYNKIDFLKLILAGFEKQSFNDFEILIADDGSRIEYSDEIKTMSNSTGLNIKHIRHEDIGFRKNKIMNKAIVESSSDYLIFIDGDCIPHREFIKEHYENRGIKICLTGRRVNLSEKISKQLTAEKIKTEYLANNFIELIYDGIFGESTYVEKGIYIRSAFLRNILNKKYRGIVGCNFSLSKEDIIGINGFDERYEAPSVGEDTDIQYRLELFGVTIKSINNTAIQYHLYHRLLSRPEKNLELFSKVKAAGNYFTPFGIKKE